MEKRAKCPLSPRSFTLRISRRSRRTCARWTPNNSVGRPPSGSRPLQVLNVLAHVWPRPLGMMHPRMPLLRLVADDLTGALDATAQFVTAEQSIPVFVNGFVPCPLRGIRDRDGVPGDVPGIRRCRGDAHCADARAQGGVHLLQESGQPPSRTRRHRAGGHHAEDIGQALHRRPGLSFSRARDARWSSIRPAGRPMAPEGGAPARDAQVQGNRVYARQGGRSRAEGPEHLGCGDRRRPPKDRAGRDGAALASALVRKRGPGRSACGRRCSAARRPWPSVARIVRFRSSGDGCSVVGMRRPFRGAARRIWVRPGASAPREIRRVPFGLPGFPAGRDAPRPPRTSHGRSERLAAAVTSAGEPRGCRGRDPCVHCACRSARSTWRSWARYAREYRFPRWSGGGGPVSA